VIALVCDHCGAIVGRVYATDDGVAFAGRIRDDGVATERAGIVGVDRRRHRRHSWAATETQLRGDDYAHSEPEAWCPEHGRMALPVRDGLLARFDKASVDRAIRVRVPPIG
jgi:hypothetical protein